MLKENERAIFTSDEIPNINAIRLVGIICLILASIVFGVGGAAYSTLWTFKIPNSYNNHVGFGAWWGALVTGVRKRAIWYMRTQAALNGHDYLILLMIIFQFFHRL